MAVTEQEQPVLLTEEELNDCTKAELRALLMKARVEMKEYLGVADAQAAQIEALRQKARDDKQRQAAVESLSNSRNDAIRKLKTAMRDILDADLQGVD